MRIVLVGNYKPDKQQSMIRFAESLFKGFGEAGLDCEVWQPVIFFGKLAKSSTLGIGKWLGYIDKWLLFPIVIRLRLHRKQFSGQNTFFHICDHSNAPYLRCFPVLRTSITCHDVLAIRGALGFSDAYCTASKFGKILQKWICKHLLQANKVVCVSEMTLKQLKELAISNEKDVNNNWRVIHVGFNANFKPLERKEAELLLLNAGIYPDIPFLLHVGSGLPRKNRKLLIDMLKIIGDNWNGKICFAGEEMNQALLNYADTLGLSERIISIVNPEHKTLLALYSRCAAFIFPSYSEGFGWPLIEAQACGAPVIASDVAPMPEVSGGTALHNNPNKPELFADSFLWLQDKKNQDSLVKEGFKNIVRFDTKKMINAYIKVFETKS